jgi:hypothetical protein
MTQTRSEGLHWTRDPTVAETLTTTLNIHKRHTFMSALAFESAIPAAERLQTHDLDRVATWIGSEHFAVYKNYETIFSSIYCEYTDPLKQIRCCVLSSSVDILYKRVVISLLYWKLCEGERKIKHNNRQELFYFLYLTLLNVASFWMLLRVVRKLDTRVSKRLVPSICRLKTAFLILTAVRIQYLSLTSINQHFMFTCGLA